MTIHSINPADKIGYNRNLYNSSVPIFTGKDTPKNFLPDENNQMSTKEKIWWSSGIVAFFISIFSIFSTPQKTSSNIQKDLLKLTKKFIKQLNPKDKELAKEFYPVLIKNTEALQIKPEHYNNIMNAVPKDNKEFMISEGFDILAGKVAKIKNILGDSLSNKLNIISSLNKDNINVFVSISDNIDRLKIADADDFQTLLTEINPQKHNYIFSQLLPNIEPYEKLLGINNPERYVKIFNHINHDTENMIPEIAKFETSENLKIDKFGIIISTTKDNKDCVIPLLNNIEKFKYNSYTVKSILKNITNKNLYSINVAANNVENIEKLNIKTEDIFKLTENKEQADILDSVLKKYEFFKIENISDIEKYIRFLKPEKTEFIANDLIPKLEGNAEIFGLNSPDQIIEVLNNITPETISGIEIISKYAQKLGTNISYPSLLGGITEKNISNLQKFLENIEKTEVWDNFMVNSKDFQKLLDTI